MTYRMPPTVTPDTQFFWDGVKQHRLLIQRCISCGRLRHPPGPMCPACQSLDWEAVEASGRGTVFSFVMPEHPRFPFLEYPYIVALVELEEGTRLVTNLVGVAPDEVRIGQPVQVTFAEFDGDVVLPQFTPAGDR
jgi:uncharacterized OB-fold protein